MAYSPTPNNQIDRVMQNFKPMFSEVRGFENAQKLEAHFLTKEGENLWAAIQFEDGFINRVTVTPQVKITIRFPAELRSMHTTWRTDNLYPLHQYTPRLQSGVSDKDPSLFTNETFQNCKYFSFRLLSRGLSNAPICVNSLYVVD